MSRGTAFIEERIELGEIVHQKRIDFEGAKPRCSGADVLTSP
jgi:hypothetical protein